MVIDESRLKSYIEKLFDSTYTAERVHMLTYRYYMAVPYQMSVKAVAQGFHSDFWTAVGKDINLWDRIYSTMAYVSISCLMVFTAAAYILSRQTYVSFLRLHKT